MRSESWLAGCCRITGNDWSTVMTPPTCRVRPMRICVRRCSFVVGDGTCVITWLVSMSHDVTVRARLPASISSPTTPGKSILVIDGLNGSDVKSVMYPINGEISIADGLTAFGVISPPAAIPLESATLISSEVSDCNDVISACAVFTSPSSVVMSTCAASTSACSAANSVGVTGDSPTAIRKLSESACIQYSPSSAKNDTVPVPLVVSGLSSGIVPARSANSGARMFEVSGKTRTEIPVASVPSGYQNLSVYCAIAIANPRGDQCTACESLRRTLSGHVGCCTLPWYSQHRRWTLPVAGHACGTDSRDLLAWLLV